MAQSEAPVLDDDELYDAQQSGHFLNISEATVYRYWRNGDLPWVPWGRRRRMRGSQIREARANGFGVGHSA